MTRSSEPDTQGAGNLSNHDSPPLDFQLLFQQSPEVLLVLLPDAPRYTMVAATEARLRVTHTTHESLGKGLFEVFPDNPDEAGATGTNNLRASLDRVLATRQPDTMAVQKYDIPGPDGNYTKKYWSPKNVPVLTATGEVQYILHRVEDVTELVGASEQEEELLGRTRDMERDVIRRSNELAVALQELRAANTQLAELDAAKTAFFSNISHEFRTPLTLMLAPLEDMLSESSLAADDPDRQQLDTVYRNALRLLKLVNILLDSSRIEAGRMSAHFEPTDLGALTAELASTFRSAVERGGLALTVDCESPPGPVPVDRDMWEKIVLNLLSNAFKHTFEGGITVRLRSSGDVVTLTVQDTGVGIPATEIPRLFERFHRVQGAASRSHEGTGIGLSLVRELAQLHGGTVEVTSEPAHGSCFTVTVRAISDVAGTRPPEAEPARPLRSASSYVNEALHWLPEDGGKIAAASDPAAADRPRILWADDNADMRDYVARLLGTDYQVIAVPDGRAALEYALASPPDLVLSDVMMPRLDGFGLLRALRTNERTRRLPVILLSARAGEESALEGLDKGADDYLVKPFSARELLARVRTHVELARVRHAWEQQLEDKVRERTAELLAENTRREATEKRLASQLERMALLDHITRAIGERQDLRSIFQVVTHNVEQNLHADICWIGLKGSDTAEELLRSEVIYEPNLRLRPAPLPPEFAARGIGSYVSASLRSDEGVIGVLIAGRREVEAFTSADCEFLRQLSEHVALAMHQTRLHESLWSAYDELRQTQQSVLQQERLGALGQMASGIAHDINNAISPAMLYVENLLDSDKDLSPRARQSLPIVLQAIEDVAATVARLREFYRPREMQATLTPVDLNQLIEQVFDLTRARWGAMPQQRGIVITVNKELAADLPQVLGSGSELREALTNLVFNAVDAMPEGGTLTLRTAAHGTQVLLDVADTGVGMDEQVRRKCLEPFFTTKGERGTGLGLAMVYGIVKRHSAEIRIASEPGRGTTFTMEFPLPDLGHGVNPVAVLPRKAPQGLRVLLIDDDAQLLKTLCESLEQDGHLVTTANDGRAGIEMFRDAPANAQFAVVFTDLGMPRMDGRAVAKEIKTLSPATPVILLTGWGQRPDGSSEMLPHIDRVIGKPPKIRDLRSALAQCFPAESAAAPLLPQDSVPSHRR